MPVGDDWRRYPFELVPGDPHFVFPAAEANHPTCESDTWFLAGELTGETDRKFAFLTHLQQEPARAGDRRRLLHARTFRPRQRHVRHLHRLRHAVDEQEERCAAEAHGGRRPPGHDVRQPCRHRGLADLPGRGGRPAALHLRRHLLRHRPARRRDAAGPARDAVARAGAAGRRGVQRRHRVLRPGDHVLLLPDRHDDDRNAVLGFGAGDGHRNHRPRRPAVVSAGGQRRWGDRRHPLPRPRMAHDQSGQRRRPEHMAAVRPDEPQCAAAVFGRHDELAGRRP